MKFRNTIILLIVFGVLLAYFFLLEKDKNPAPSYSTPIPTSAKVFTFASKDAVGLSLTDGTKSLALKRNDDTAPWQIVTPASEEADSVRVNSAVEQLSTLTASRVFTDAESTGDLAAFGLAKPKLDVTAKLKDGKDYVLHVGDKTPESINVYVQTADDKAIYLVSSTLSDDLLAMLATPPLKPTPTPTLTPTATATVTATVGVTTTVPVSGTPIAPTTAPVTPTAAISSTPAVTVPMVTATTAVSPTVTAAVPTATPTGTVIASPTTVATPTAPPTTALATATPTSVPTLLSATTMITTSTPAVTPTTGVTPTLGLTATP